MDAAATGTPVSGPRSRDRRAEIARNAGELFSARGFHAVRMEDIAEASGITARRCTALAETNRPYSPMWCVRTSNGSATRSALFSSLPTDDRTLDTSLVTMTNRALDSRRLSLLWQREAAIDGEDYHREQHARSRARQVGELTIGSNRPDLDGPVADIKLGRGRRMQHRSLRQPALAATPLHGLGRGKQQVTIAPTTSTEDDLLDGVWQEPDLPARAAGQLGGKCIPRQRIRRSQYRRHRWSSSRSSVRSPPTLRQQGRDPGRPREPLPRVVGLGNDPRYGRIG